MDGAFNPPAEFYKFYTRDTCGPPRCIIGNTDNYMPRGTTRSSSPCGPNHCCPVLST